MLCFAFCKKEDMLLSPILTLIIDYETSMQSNVLPFKDNIFHDRSLVTLCESVEWHCQKNYW